MKIKYVLGFIFDSKLENVLLLEKIKPDWQKGYLNGIGGAVELNESYIYAMSRECKEKTQLEISLENWINCGKMNICNKDKSTKIRVFCSISNKIHDLHNKIVEKERLFVINLKELNQKNILNNLSFLVPFCFEVIKQQDKNELKINLKYFDVDY